MTDISILILISKSNYKYRPMISSRYAYIFVFAPLNIDIIIYYLFL